MHPKYHKMIVGDPGTSVPIVCDDGIIRQVRTEVYHDGYHFFIRKDDGDYTNHAGYPTNRKAINAAARLASA